MVTRAFVTPQILNYVLVIIAIFFYHRLTQTSWCCAISASLEVNFLLGTKVLADPAHPGRVAVSGPLHCHSVSRNSPSAQSKLLFHQAILPFFGVLVQPGRLKLVSDICTLPRQRPWVLVCAAEAPCRGARGGISLRAPHHRMDVPVVTTGEFDCVPAGLCSRYNPLP